MCIELFLAIVYFLTICTVNYFLFNLLKSYFQKISYSLKMNALFQNYSPNDLQSIILSYIRTKKEQK